MFKLISGVALAAALALGANSAHAQDLTAAQQEALPRCSDLQTIQASMESMAVQINADIKRYEDLESLIPVASSSTREVRMAWLNVRVMLSERKRDLQGQLFALKLNVESLGDLYCKP